MKWPRQVVLIRHGESAYNVLKAQKEADPLYQKFRKAYEEDHRSLYCQELARKVKAHHSLDVSDYQTPLTPRGQEQAVKTGEGLAREMKLPHVILVSPYFRTRATLLGMTMGWPELATVKTVFEDRIREQEHGLSLIYNDWRVFHAMHPEQKELHDLLGPYWYQFPQGESVSEVRERIRSFQSMLIRECSGKRVMVITHHLTILSIRSLQEGWTPEDFMDEDDHNKPINCGVTFYKGCVSAGRDGKLVLDRYNLKYY